jgi:hypothetical protein
MLQVLAGWRCEPVCAGGRLRLDDERAFPLGLQLAPRLCPSCPDEYEVSFAEFPRDDCMVTPCFVWAWYLFRACRAKTRSPSMRSFEVGSSTSGTADDTVRGDPCFISCEVMASDPYRRRKGVNPVALHSVVFSAQTASGNKSTHLPFFSSRSIFLTAVKILPFARSTTPLDCGCQTACRCQL